jgi:SAM-dependent methyltransferase
VAGYARSGSTLLDRLLGQIEGFASFGELRHIWYRSFLENQLCGCGRPFHECPFWSEVVQRAFGGFDHVDAEEIGRNKARVDAPVNIPRILTGGWTPSFRRRMANYARSLETLYRTIQEVSGARYVVDSTKDPQHMFILRTIAGFDVRVIHLVRDSRAVAYSWRRVRLRPEIHWEARAMPRYPVVRTALAWNANNSIVEMSRRLGMPYARVRYEDLVLDPAGELDRVMTELDLPRASLAFLEPGQARLSPTHSCSGNPMRFDVGPVAITPDSEWSTGMRAAERSLVTELTRPLLMRYGYLGAPFPTQPRHLEPASAPPSAPAAPAPARLPAGPRPVEMWRTLRLAIAHRRDPVAYGRAASGLVVRFLSSRAVPIIDRRWLDVGTGVGTLPEALREAGARVVALDVEDRRAMEAAVTSFVVGTGSALPFRTDAFDGVVSSNVVEHVPNPTALIAELVRVCRPNGVVYVSWTNWYSPFGGHEWSPFHYAGARLGPWLYRTVRRSPIRNVPGQTLFPAHVGSVLRMVRGLDVDMVDVVPRYWPSLRVLARVPGVREVTMWNCVIVMRKRPSVSTA